MVSGEVQVSQIIQFLFLLETKFGDELRSWIHPAHLPGVFMLTHLRQISPFYTPQLFFDGFRGYKLSVIRQKSESQNECFKKTKHTKFSEKRTFVTPWYLHVRKTKDRISKRVFQENEASQIFRKGTFLTPRYAHVYKAKGRISKRVFQENKARQIFQKTNISYLLIRSFALLVRIRG